jgi:hypothetical protein
MGAIFLYVTIKILLAIRGGPYMTPLVPELAARVQARYRDISLHTMSEKGTKIKDTIMTISQTAKKLGVRTYEYLYDRVSGHYNMTSLSQLIAVNSSDYVPVN